MYVKYTKFHNYATIPMLTSTYLCLHMSQPSYTKKNTLSCSYTSNYFHLPSHNSTTHSFSFIHLKMLSFAFKNLKMLSVCLHTPQTTLIYLFTAQTSFIFLHTPQTIFIPPFIHLKPLSFVLIHLSYIWGLL